MGKGLAIHTLHEERDLNDYAGLFDHLPSAKPDPDMIQLATQLIDRQTGKYDPSDVEDRYETRLRAVTSTSGSSDGRSTTTQALLRRAGLAAVEGFFVAGFSAAPAFPAGLALPSRQTSQ